MHWDDLRVFLTIQREGSIRAAATALGVSRSTVARRVEMLQAEANAALLERTPDGVVLTPMGEELVPIARRAEAEALAAARLFAGSDVRLSGRLDLTVFDAAASVVAPVLQSFREAHPEVELRLFVDNALRSLRRREADVAIRGTSQPAPELFGRKLGQMGYAVYGTRERARQRNPPWVIWDEAMGAKGTWAVARQSSRRLEIAARVDDLGAMIACARAGVGVALLPVPLARALPELVAKGPVPRKGAGLDVWMLTHPDLRRSPRVRALMRFLGDAVPALL